MTRRHFFGSIIGNVLEHYDNALFGLLAPFIAPLFFPNSSQLAALILTYGMLAIGIFSKPFGAFIFGFIGDRYGRKRALAISLIGMAVVTTCIGCLPTYATIGPMAPILLALGRLAQAFFSAGETTGGALYLLEASEEGKKSFLSSLYDCSSILGIFLASLIVTLFCFGREIFVHFWRVPFFFGSLCGVIGMFIRNWEEDEEAMPTSIRSHFRAVWQHRKSVVPIVMVSGFSYAVYTFSVTLMNGFLPLVSGISNQEASALNTFLLLIDFLLLPFFGFVAAKWGKEKLMRTSSSIALIVCIPLFMQLSGASIVTALIVRLFFVTIGVAFAAAYHHWSQEQVPPSVRFTVVATATALGAQIIGKPSVVISLWLYQKTGWVAAPGIYLTVTAALALKAIGFKKTVSVQTNP